MKLFPSGRIYDWCIEPIVKNIKQRVSVYFRKYDLFPALDICCGTGTQCFLLEELSPHVFGLDMDWSLIAYAAMKYPQIGFVCADAVKISFQENLFKGILFSFSLHEKTPKTRDEILIEAKRVLSPGGYIVFVDFENPWNRRSKIGAIFSYLIERLSGGEHFQNNRQFLKEGGLRAFLEKHQFREIERHNVEWGSVAVVVAKAL